MHPSNEVPYLCLSARFMLISSFYACQHILSLSVLFVLIGNQDCFIDACQVSQKL
jgi:hypothetical protein